MERDDTRERILRQIAGLQREIAECPYCVTLRKDIVKLVNLCPPEPIVMRMPSPDPPKRGNIKVGE